MSSRHFTSSAPGICVCSCALRHKERREKIERNPDMKQRGDHKYETHHSRIDAKILGNPAAHSTDLAVILDLYNRFITLPPLFAAPAHFL